MTEWIEPHPEAEVQTAEYQRLLGYPSGHVLGGRAKELAEWARAWYAAHGRPWIYAREAGSIGTGGASVLVEGVRFHSGVLRRRFEQSAADSAVLAAVSAGPEIEEEAQKLWREEKPDEYYFLEVLGSAVVEQLTAMTGARLCAWADGKGMAVLPHYSPGYPGWDIAEQPRLLELFQAGALPRNLEALESGALRPKKSLLAVFGLTRHTTGVRRLTEMQACENCALPACEFRRSTGGGYLPHSSNRSGRSLVGRSPWTARDALVPLPEAEAGAPAPQSAANRNNLSQADTPLTERT